MTDSGKFFDEEGGIKRKIQAGTFKIANVIERDDGSISYEFEYDEDFALYYKLETGKKRITKKGISKFILKILEERKKGTGKGYTIKKSTEERRRKFYKVYKQ
jgi:hypothetical protein